MLIYFIDTICPKGHIELNKKIIALMPNKFRKVVINSNDYYNFREIKDASFININLINFKSRMLTIFFTQLFNFLFLLFYCLKSPRKSFFITIMLIILELNTIDFFSKCI